MRKLWIALFPVVLAAIAQPPVEHGRELYEKRCAGCHALDKMKVGPALRNTYGRRAAADSAFPYSDALRKARVTWDESTLDRWLADPEGVVPDNDMAFRLDDSNERAAIIAYLKQLSSSQGRRSWQVDWRYSAVCSHCCSPQEPYIRLGE
jgi:cytochrome c